MKWLAREIMFYACVTAWLFSFVFLVTTLILFHAITWIFIAPLLFVCVVFALTLALIWLATASLLEVARALNEAQMKNIREFNKKDV